MSKLHPLGDRVVIKALDQELTTKSGIVLPESAQEKSNQGVVVAVGSGKVDDNGKKITPEVKTGDVVLFSEYAGQKVKMEGEEYQVIRLDDILAIIE